MKKPEILAPAGSVQALQAVIEAGCDAVYMGGSRFGARAYAENPEKEEMIQAIRYCHLHDVKLYLTVNTLLKEKEIKELYDFMLPYYEAGVDAVLVQDMGVLSALHRWFPDLKLHASTQMTITQGKTAEFLKDYGITRIVPARELSLSELQRMRQETDAEIEVFVHGALCYCFSGQCLFSSMQGGRSGNRGRCAQPCRQLYRMGKTGNKGYFLSPKELCALSFLPELCEAGVDSFKIEGRMKRPEYAAFVTSIYRKYMDIYTSMGTEGYQAYLASHQEDWEEDMKNLADLYNREGFTSGYLEGCSGEVEKRHPGKRGEMLSVHRPGHGGVLVGRVLSVGKSEVVYEALSRIHAQDVVEFRDAQMTALYEYTLGTGVEKGEHVTARYKKGTKLSVGNLLYRTKNQELLLETEKRYVTKKSQLPVRGCFRAEPGKKISLSVKYGEYQTEVFGDVSKPAKNQPATEDMVRKTLMKTGESTCFFENLEIIIEKGLFFRVGELKELRREAFYRLECEILQRMERTGVLVKAQDPQPLTKGEKKREGELLLSASVMDLEQLEEVLLHHEIERVYLHTEKLNGTEEKQAFFRIREAGKRAFLALPMVFRSGVEKIFRREWEKETGALDWEGVLVKNQEALLFAWELQKQRTLEIVLDAGAYIMNEGAYRFYKDRVSLMTFPYELTWDEMKRASWLRECELIGYGRVPLMVSAQCIQANTEYCAYAEKKKWNREIFFSDEKKRGFLAVNFCKYCYNVIYQENPVCLREVLADRKQYPVRSFRYAFTTETGKEVREILAGNPPFDVWAGHFYKGIE